MEPGWIVKTKAFTELVGDLFEEIWAKYLEAVFRTPFGEPIGDIGKRH